MQQLKIVLTFTLISIVSIVAAQQKLPLQSVPVLYKQTIPGDFSFTREWNYPWYMIKDEATGTFEKTISDSLGNNTLLPEDTVYLHHTARIRLNHQGEHEVHYVHAWMENEETLIIATEAELPAYGSTVNIKIKNGSAVFSFQNVPFEALYNEQYRYTPIRQSLVLNKKIYKTGDTIKGKMEYRFREDYYKNGTKVSSRMYTASGIFEVVIGAE